MSMNLPRIRVRVLWAVFACVYFFSALWMAGAVYYLGLPDALRIPAVLFFHHFCSGGMFLPEEIPASRIYRTDADPPDPVSFAGAVQ